MRTWHVGTSGWSYRHWCGPFYPSTPDLSFYARYFDCVELDGTFYRLPSPTAVAHWRDQTPPHFRFAWKASRFLTHIKRLRDPEEPVRNIARATGPLGDRLGPVLFQLPPRFGRDVGRLRALLAALPPHLQAAVELRDPEWHHPEVWDALREAGAATVAWELGGERSPLVATADFVYARLHGPGAAYRGRYGPDGVRRWADALEALGTGEIWAFFDNDERAYAVADAMLLREIRSAPPTAPASRR